MQRYSRELFSVAEPRVAAWLAAWIDEYACFLNGLGREMVWRSGSPTFPAVSFAEY